MAKAIVRTVRPKAKATPANPMPTEGKPAASTAAPHPPKTSQNVPKNSAAARMPQFRFHIYTFAGSWPWCFGLTYVGMKLGEAWHTDPRFHEWFHRFHLVVEIALLACVVWFVWSHINRGRQQETA